MYQDKSSYIIKEIKKEKLGIIIKALFIEVLQQKVAVIFVDVALVEVADKKL